MSERFLKGIFAIFGFFFFLEIIWMVGAYFEIAEPFCLVIGKKPLKCSAEGNIRVSAKQFCIGQNPFGHQNKKKSNNSSLESKQINTAPGSNYPIQNGFPPPQGYVTQDQLRAQQMYQQQLINQQQEYE